MTTKNKKLLMSGGVTAYIMTSLILTVYGEKKTRAIGIGMLGVGAVAGLILFIRKKEDEKKEEKSNYLGVTCVPNCKSNEVCVKGACVEKEIKKTPSFFSTNGESQRIIRMKNIRSNVEINKP